MNLALDKLGSRKVSMAACSCLSCAHSASPHRASDSSTSAPPAQRVAGACSSAEICSCSAMGADTGGLTDASVANSAVAGSLPSARASEAGGQWTGQSTAREDSATTAQRWSGDATTPTMRSVAGEAPSLSGCEPRRVPYCVSQNVRAVVAV